MAIIRLMYISYGTMNYTTPRLISPHNGFNGNGAYMQCKILITLMNCKI